MKTSRQTIKNLLCTISGALVISLGVSGQSFAANLGAANLTAANSGINSYLAADTKDNAPRSFSGNASWYGPGFHGRKTASGEIFDQNKCTAAHLKLPFATRVLVEDPRTGNTVIVKINDRGPYVRTRIMDLAKGAAKKLGTLPRGVAYIDCLILDNNPDQNM